MARWVVTLPVTGTVSVEVEADDEDAAIEAALCADVKNSDIEEWEMHRQVNQGNICYSPIGEAFAEPVDE